MEFLAQSDARIEQLRGEHTVNLAHGCHLLYAAMDLDMERDPLLDDQLVDVEAELMRRVEEVRAATTAPLPERGNPVGQDFDGISDAELEHELRDLAISSGLAEQGSVIHLMAMKRMRAIDAELARRAGERDQ
jgi:hypothetical protein